MNGGTDYNNVWSVGFEVLTAVVMENSIFWNITLRSPLKVNLRFGGTCRLHLQGLRISQARSQRDAGRRLNIITLRSSLTFGTTCLPFSILIHLFIRLMCSYGFRDQVQFRTPKAHTYLLHLSPISEQCRELNMLRSKCVKWSYC
jgi:hypothetical protein